MIFLGDEYWEVKATKEKGLGVFAKKRIKSGTVIGDYLGKVISNLEYDPVFEQEGLYLMYLTDEASIFPDLGKPGLHLFNHSCKPNCHFYIYKLHTLFFALRNIYPREELTVSYMLCPKETCDNCTHNCRCGSKKCTGTMHLTKKQYKKWREYQDNQQSNIKKGKVVIGEYLPKLSSYPKKILMFPLTYQ